MARSLLNLPVNIPWKLVGVSSDMMDTAFCDKEFPFVWSSSLAISAYEPKIEELPDELCEERVTFLKVSCTITGYQPTREETAAVLKLADQFHDIHTENILNELEEITREYFACYGVLLNVAVFPPASGRPIPAAPDLKQFPHIIDFEPKVRDLYQAATENGEILTASVSAVKTDKTFSHTETTQTGLSLAAKYAPSAGSEIAGSLSHQWGETDQDTFSVETDASRERRERNATTTELSQLYNLLTGYHPGTNRASFLMLARPHVLQPTDRRTFVQGLRAIEGVQDFFLIISRPPDMPGLAIEASLETGHFPEGVNIEEPEEEFDESSEDFIVTAFADNSTVLENCSNIESDPSSIYTIGAGWIIDRRPKRQRAPDAPVGSGWDVGHAGVAEIANDSNDQANDSLDNYNYHATSDVAVQVTGRICGERWQGDKARFKRTYRVFTRSEKPRPGSSGPSADVSRLVITRRQLCVCIRSGERCVEAVECPGVRPVPGDFVVAEPKIRVRKALLGRTATGESRFPAMKELMQQIQSFMINSWRMPDRLEFGKVGFLESEYFKDRLLKIVPRKKLDETVSIGQAIPDASQTKISGEIKVGDLLKLDIATLMQKTGLDIDQALKLRKKLLGIQ
jgi:hypothetical protein